MRSETFVVMAVFCIPRTTKCEAELFVSDQEEEQESTVTMVVKLLRDFSRKHTPQISHGVFFLSYRRFSRIIRPLQVPFSPAHGIILFSPPFRLSRSAFILFSCILTNNDNKRYKEASSSPRRWCHFGIQERSS